MVYSLKDFSDNLISNGVCGGAVIEELRYKPKVAGSIPDSVTGIFH
jgi:hypothetical protein